MEQARVIQLGVLSGAGREPMLERTVAELEERGGAAAASSRVVYYSAPNDAPSPSLPDGWQLVRRHGPNGGGADFRWMIGELTADSDALLFEDDVQPVRNAIPAMLKHHVREGWGAISFYDAGDTIGHLYAGTRTGVHVVPASGPNDLGFHGAQALRLPAWLIYEIQRGDHDPPHRGQDVWIGQLLHRKGLKIAVTCPSLVQHVGDDSMCTPGATLAGARAPSANFPGEDFDALGVYPETITPGPWTPRARITWCEFHGIDHEGATGCPRIVR